MKNSFFINLSVEQSQVKESVSRTGLIQLQTESGKDYWDLLVDKYHNNSATHSNFINLKKDLISGEFYSETQSAETIRFLNSQNCNEILEKISFDLSLFETAYLQILWNLDRSKIVEIDYLDRTCVTPVESDEYGKVSRYAVTTKSLKKNSSVKKFTHYHTYPAFSTKSTQDENGEQEYTQVLEIRRYAPGNQYITIPSYNAVLNYIDIEKELSQFHLSSIVNGFFSSAVLNIKGSPTEDQKNAFVEEFKKSFNGSTNASKVLFNFVESDEYKIELVPLQVNNNSDLFNTLNDIAIQKISTGHRGNTDLAGVTTQGSDLGGDANKLFVSWNLFKSSVTDPLQKLAVQAFNKILSVNGLNTIKIKSELPIQLFPEALLEKITTVNERRSMLLGLGKIEDQQNENETQI